MDREYYKCSDKNTNIDLKLDHYLKYNFTITFKKYQNNCDHGGLFILDYLQILGSNVFTRIDEASFPYLLVYLKFKKRLQIANLFYRVYLLSFCWFRQVSYRKNLTFSLVISISVIFLIYIQIFSLFFASNEPILFCYGLINREAKV